MQRNVLLNSTKPKYGTQLFLIQQDDILNQQTTHFARLISVTWHGHVHGRKIAWSLFISVRADGKKHSRCIGVKIYGSTMWQWIMFWILLTPATKWTIHPNVLKPY